MFPRRGTGCHLFWGLTLCVAAMHVIMHCVFIRTNQRMFFSARHTAPPTGHTVERDSARILVHCESVRRGIQQYIRFSPYRRKPCIPQFTGFSSKRKVQINAAKLIACSLALVAGNIRQKPSGWPHADVSGSFIGRSNTSKVTHICNPAPRWVYHIIRFFFYFHGRK